MPAVVDLPVVVVGGGLAGMAAAARLAKAGHRVALLEATDRLGGHWAATRLADGTPVDAAPAVVGFPAPWRDLFRKSGRTLEAELARTGARLVPAAPARYRFGDGTELAWPADRGLQYATLSQTYATSVADRWRDLVDRLDDVWQAIRPLGLEAELAGRHQLTPGVRALLQPRKSIADLAREIGQPQLAALIRSSAYRQGGLPERTPAWRAVVLSVERRFGRWTVAADAPDVEARTGRTSTLVEALAARLELRRVEVELGTRVGAVRIEDGRATGVVLSGGQVVAASAVVCSVDVWQLVDRLLPRSAARSTRRRVRRLRPASVPALAHRRLDSPAGGVAELVELTTDGVPTVTYTRPVTGGSLATVHDYRAARADPSAGVAWDRFGGWLQRPPVRSEVPGLFVAGPHTPAGGGLSETVLAGALASYAVHDALTG